MEKKEEFEIINCVELVEVSNLDNTQKVEVEARVDTGASKSSIGIELAAKLGLGPIISYTQVKNANGSSKRAILEANIRIGKKKVKEKFTIANRANMKYKVLVGRNVLRNNFLVKVNKDEGNKQ